MKSKIEKNALQQAGQKLRIEPEEKMGVIVVDNFPRLGLLTALRFIEWVQQNPEGVISLPTGKTPEHFIKIVTQLLETWQSSDTRAFLEQNHLDPASRPDMSKLHFIQMDEFYPIDPGYQNSFYYYIHKYYMKLFGLDPQKGLFIDGSKIGLPKGYALETVWPEGSVDLSLRYRHPASKQETIQKDVLLAMDQWCFEYGEQIRSLGGIGFFLGGIGPDGHIAFNIAGSDHHCTTRLTPTNYETQAAAATDLGGIEVARQRHAITIGLSTITSNPDCTAIIMAAGEAKAQVVADAICQLPHIRYPATALHKLPNARFFLTQGASKFLKERQFQCFQQSGDISGEIKEKIITSLSLALKKSIQSLSARDCEHDRFCHELIKRQEITFKNFRDQAHKYLVQKIENGSQVRLNTRFLHTAPHHDDIMLGYFPYAVRHMRDASNQHTFAYLTSGFTAVTNSYALSITENLQRFLKNPEFKELIHGGYFNPAREETLDDDVWRYLDGVAADRPFMKREGEARRFLRILMTVFNEEDSYNLEDRMIKLITYFKTQYAGKKDQDHIQKIKGMIREWEAECLWGYLGIDPKAVKHLRLGFYQGELFTEEPTLHRDVNPVVSLLQNAHPDVVTVALDPEASGPDTHYKVMQTVASALQQYEESSGRSDIEIWGYRNVWYHFDLHEANCYVPVSMNMFAVMQSAFINAFVSQKDASFPSYAFDGPFSGLAQKIQVEQYELLKTCLGPQFFNDHKSPLIRGARGFVFLKKMSLKEFYTHSRNIRELTESKIVL